jgi:hypothetical protein
MFAEGSAIETGPGTVADRPLAGKFVRWSIPIESSGAPEPDALGERTPKKCAVADPMRIR